LNDWRASLCLNFCSKLQYPTGTIGLSVLIDLRDTFACEWNSPIIRLWHACREQNTLLFVLSEVFTKICNVTYV
jgi:hypothetical protein